MQSSREAARRTECGNNLRQVALAFQLHEGAQGHFPTGGWGWNWTGDPDRGFGEDQPGGWAYNILPYIEHADLRRLPEGRHGEERRAATRQMVSTPVSALSCPSRRSPDAYPNVLRLEYPNLGRPERCARSDYAVNLGAIEKPRSQQGPLSYEMAATWKTGKTPNASWIATELDGIVFQRSQVELQHVIDGLSNTCLLGEKYIPRQHYTDGKFLGDNENLFMGYDQDILRSLHRKQLPLRDGDEQHVWRLGSAHPSSFHMALCDGSVQSIDYEISSDIFHAYGSRYDESVASQAN